MFCRLILCFSLLAPPALAHSPVLDLSAKSITSPFEITEPEHSKAIYSELDGTAQYFRISSDKDFNFYVGLTAPKRDGCDLAQTFSFDVLDSQGKRIDGRKGNSVKWEPWYEEYGKKWYWVGPEIGEKFASTTRYPAGDYFVKVYNAKNRGRYVLAVGDVERFGVGTLLTLRGTMNEINAKFWAVGCD